MRLLDLFCGAGGAAEGYNRAGFDEIVGVDIKPQPRYKGDTFIQGDALEYVREHGHEFDAIHASPPCQAYSEATPLRFRGNHPDLIDSTRALLIKSGKPFVIENVEGARRKMVNPIMLCGTMFGLPIWRHRFFECCPMWFMSPRSCDHSRRPVFLVNPGSHSRKLTTPILITDHGGPNANGKGKPRKRTQLSVKREAAEIDWMSEDEISQAIPPAYTEYIGKQLLEVMK